MIESTIRLIPLSCTLLFALVLSACNEVNPVEKHTSSTPIQPTPTQPSLSEQAEALKTQADCETAQGHWKKRGKLQQYACVLPATDAGKACSDSQECQVACVVEGFDLNPGSKVVGQCLESTEQFGCRAYVRDGRTDGVLCID